MQRRLRFSARRVLRAPSRKRNAFHFLEIRHHEAPPGPGIASGSFPCLLPPVQAQLTAWPVPRGPSHEPAPYTYDPAILKTVPHAFIDDASACVLYSGTSHLIQADGTVETITHEITRLGSRKGIDTLGEYQAITFNPSFETLTLNEARIHKKRGGIVQIEPRHVQLRDVGTDFQVYNPDKQFVISFPNLEVGDVYEVKWTVRGKNPEFGDNFFARYNFGDDRQPVVRDELHVVLPKDKPFHYATINGKVNLKVTDRGPASVDRQDSSPPSTNAGPRSTVHGPRSTVHDPRFTHYYWWVTNKPALPQDDEKPSLEDFRLQVAFSTYANWDAVGRWKNQLRAECWKCTPGLQKVIADVAGPQKTPLEKARALTYWVRRQVRYVSRGPGGLGYTPNLPEQVLANRYGDCKDQAQLLAVMLKQLGLPVYLVTLGPVDDGQVLPDVPAPWGTHAILLVKIDGQDHWIDTTVSHAGWDYLPRGHRNRQVYVTRVCRGDLLSRPVSPARIVHRPGQRRGRDGRRHGQHSPAGQLPGRRPQPPRRLGRNPVGRTPSPAGAGIAGLLHAHPPCQPQN